MKNVSETIRKVIDLISIIMIVTGIVFLISLFFVSTFPFWRIMIAIVPIILGIIIRGVNAFVFLIIELVKNTDQTIKTIKQDRKAQLDPFKKNSPKSLILLGIVCSLFTIILALLTLFVLNRFAIPSGYAETNGIITDVVMEKRDTKFYYFQVVEYEVNDEIYTTKSNYTSRNGMNSTIGNKLVIYYNVDNPEEVIFKNAPVIVNVLAIGIDIGFAVFSVILITSGIKKLRKEKCLNSNNNLQIQ